MRHFAINLFTIALLLTAAQAEDWSKTYTVEHAPQLRVDTSDADIRLDTWDQNKIEAHVVTERWKIGEDGIKILERQTGDGRISVNHLKGEMDFYSGDGRLEVDDVDGNLRAHTGDGSIRVSGRFDS